MKRILKAIATGAFFGMLLTSCGNSQGTDKKMSPTEQSSPGRLAASRNAPIPAFTRLTEIINPYFPLTELGGYRLVGQEDGKPYEAKIVVADETKSIAWAACGTSVRT